MHINTIKSRLQQAREICGGRFALSIGAPGDLSYITHWIRSGPSAFEDCKAVGVGTEEECLRSLNDYINRWQLRPTDEQVGQMLGLVPAEVEQPMAAE